MITYDAVLKRWMETPIAIGQNPMLPGRLLGNDSGYRNMRTLDVNPAPLVEVDVFTRAAYEGACPYTGQFVGNALGGGLAGGKFVLREAAARSVYVADQLLQKLSGNSLKFVGLDAFRSGLRQQFGYSGKLREQMAMIGLTDEDVNADRRIADFIGCSIRADGVFSWVKVAQDDIYKALAAELMSIPAILEGAREYAASNMDGGATGGNVDDALYEYVIASRNSGIGRTAQRGTLVWECNAHAGGGACDLMIADGEGRILAITPFDYPGFMSAYDFLETDANFDVYIKELLGNAVLRDHAKRLRLNPGFVSFTWENWVYLRDIKRIQYHLARACGWTFYSMGTHGGEHWHEEPGNIVRDPLTQEVLWVEPETGVDYPDRGNPGHSLQKFGPNDVGVWGGATAHALAKSKFGLEMDI